MKTVIEMAINAGLEITYEYEDGDLELSGDKKALERFAELARADEREACAKVCDELSNWYTPKACAAHIRARRNT